MILFLLLFILISFIIVLLAFKFTTTKTKEYPCKRISKKYFFIYIFLLFSISITTYIHKSNYWVGDAFFNKIITNKTFEQLNEVDTLLYYIKQLEEGIKKKPNDYDKIKKLAETKYLLGDFSESYRLFHLARKITPNDLGVIIGEANSKLFLEKGDPSKETIKLFEKILEKDKSNLLALLILGDYLVKENNLLNAKNLYLRLLKLLVKDSKEYIEIKNKISSIEEKINDK